MPRTLRGRRCRRSTRTPAAAPSAAVAAGSTTFFAALATPLAALLPTSLARSAGRPLREAAVRERDAARAFGRDPEPERELGRLEVERLLEAGLAPPPGGGGGGRAGARGPPPGGVAFAPRAAGAPPCCRG